MRRLSRSRQAKTRLKKVQGGLQQKVAEMRKEIEGQKKAMEWFVNITSHDLHEPLHTIIGFIDRLRSHLGPESDERSRDYLERMERSAKRMSQLIESLLVYSRFGRKLSALEVINLRSVIQELVADMQSRLLETGASVELGELPDVYGDKIQLKQLFQNLLSNAIKCRRKETPPLIKLFGRRQGEKRLVIQIEDNGIGFDPKFSEMIFKPFERLHSHAEYEGSGLGLAICKKIVENHRGEIKAKSEPGRGATFTILFQVIPDRQRRAKANSR